MPIDDFDVEIRAYDPARHDRAGFDCGVERLNNYLALTAKKQQKIEVTRIYVALKVGHPRILGYYAINTGSMNVDAMPKRHRDMPSHGDLPVLFLGQIAVSKDTQGAGIGSILMHHVFQKAQIVAEEAGCYAILLDVMSDGAEDAFDRRKGWYAEYGFQSTANDPARMFLTMKDVRASLDPQK